MGREPPPSGEASSEAAERSSILCSPRAQWTEANVHIEPSSAPAKVSNMKLWLLGDQARRGQLDRTLPLAVDGARALAALDETQQCMQVELIDNSA